MNGDEFYVGYQKTAPAGIARFVRTSVVGVLVLAAFLAGMLVSAQKPFARAFFEFGEIRQFEGFISEYPYPALLVPRPGDTGGSLPFSRYLLVAPGKFGAAGDVAGLDGRRVSVDGTLIYRDDVTMVEIVPGSVTAVRDDGISKQPEQDLGRFSLRGEIVDSKCFLGVMKPGSLKPHRACAIRCISGGVPPVFLVRDNEHNAIYLMLVGEDGRRLNDEVDAFVAEPLEIEGRVLRKGSALIFEADPDGFERVGR